jgi:rod shape determining protein RodA
MPLGIDRRLLYNVDWVLLGSALMLSLVGVAMVFSATHTGGSPDQHLKQLALVGAGLVGLVVAAATDYRRLADRSILLYIISVVALVYVLRFGPLIAGTRRWIVIGGFQLQPSEFVKLAAAVLLAKIFAEYRQESLGLRDLVWPGAAVGFLVLLIAREPDLGTAACLVPMVFTVAFLAGLRVRAVVGLVRTGSQLAPGSGDYVIAFSTARCAGGGCTAFPERRLAKVFQAVSEGTVEAIYNSMLRATTVVGYKNHRAEAVPLELFRSA